MALSKFEYLNGMHGPYGELHHDSLNLAGKSSAVVPQVLPSGTVRRTAGLMPLHPA